MCTPVYVYIILCTVALAIKYWFSFSSFIEVILATVLVFVKVLVVVQVVVVVQMLVMFRCWSL
jgi:hypothetical protein